MTCGRECAQARDSTTRKLCCQKTTRSIVGCCSDTAMDNRYLLVTIIISTTYILCEGESFKRELPLLLDCNPNAGTCAKGDLIDTSIADCEKDGTFTCTPINNHIGSNVVDLPSTNCYFCSGCKPVSRTLRCGAAGTDTRCVCRKVAFSLANTCRCQYWPEEDIRSNEPSYCTQYDHGGTTGVHFYTCCNNCNDPGDQSCAGTVYQGGGTTGNDYCDRCGVHSSAGGGRVTYRFNCGSCSQQRECEMKCDKKWYGITKTTPGLCPKWAGCFRGCCIESQKENRKRDTGVDEFCGDFVCQETENSKTCPIDCCPLQNPTNCTIDECSPECCMQPECCSSSSQSLTSVSFYIIFFVILISIENVG